MRQRQRRSPPPHQARAEEQHPARPRPLGRPLDAADVHGGTEPRAPPAGRDPGARIRVTAGHPARRSDRPVRRRVVRGDDRRLQGASAARGRLHLLPRGRLGHLAAAALRRPGGRPSGVDGRGGWPPPRPWWLGSPTTRTRSEPQASGGQPGTMSASTCTRGNLRCASRLRTGRSRRCTRVTSGSGPRRPLLSVGLADKAPWRFIRLSNQSPGGVSADVDGGSGLLPAAAASAPAVAVVMASPPSQHRRTGHGSTAAQAGH